MHVSTLLSPYRLLHYRLSLYRAAGFFTGFCSPAARGTRPRLASLLGGVVVAADFWAASLRRTFVAVGVFIIFSRRDLVAAGIPKCFSLRRLDAAAAACASPPGYFRALQEVVYFRGCRGRAQYACVPQASFWFSMVGHMAISSVWLFHFRSSLQRWWVVHTARAHRRKVSRWASLRRRTRFCEVARCRIEHTTINHTTINHTTK